MKKSTLTLLLVLCLFSVKAQSKKDSIKVLPQFGGGKVAIDTTFWSKGFSIMPYYNTPSFKSDTVKCWFKEMRFKYWWYDQWRECRETDRAFDINGRVIEVIPYEVITAGYSYTINQIRSEYLYYDRKTKVTNTVIYSIPRK